MRLLLTVVHSEGITALVATHDEALIDLADEVIRLEDERIRSGHYPKDSRIPTESELTEEFEIGRNTTRRAVEVLRERGLVETVKTRGSYVL
jgi:DNA-binding FadR family transcriptional regulator